MFVKIRKVASNSTVTEVPEVVSKSFNRVPVPLKRTVDGYHDGTKKIQGKGVAPMLRKESISKYQGDTRKIHEEREWCLKGLHLSISIHQLNLQ